MTEVDLLAVAGRRLRDRADHERRRERPRLRAVDDDTAEAHAALLPDLAADGLLDRLAGLQEPGQRAEPVRREALVAAQQQPGPVGADHGDDDGRVRPREAHVGHAVPRGAVGPLRQLAARQVRRRAGALRAGVYREGLAAARGAEGDARVPVQEGARVGVYGRWGM